MNHQPTVAVLGASADPSKYGNISLRAHQEQGYRVYPIHPTAQEIEGLEVFSKLTDVPEASLDRITVYVPPRVLLTLLEDIAATPHKELYLNPGTESPKVLARAEELGLDPIQACSIIDLQKS